jgi:hypothetical protein
MRYAIDGCMLAVILWHLFGEDVPWGELAGVIGGCVPGIGGLAGPMAGAALGALSGAKAASESRETRESMRPLHTATRQ